MISSKRKSKLEQKKQISVCKNIITVKFRKALEMKNREIIEIKKFEGSVMPYFGKPEEDELPQVASEEDIITTITDTIQ